MPRRQTPRRGDHALVRRKHPAAACAAVALAPQRPAESISPRVDRSRTGELLAPTSTHTQAPHAPSSTSLPHPALGSWAREWCPYTSRTSLPCHGTLGSRLGAQKAGTDGSGQEAAPYLDSHAGKIDVPPRHGADHTQDARVDRRQHQERRQPVGVGALKQRPLWLLLCLLQESVTAVTDACTQHA